MRLFLRNCRHDVRWMAQSPGVAAAALGIGANTVIFSVVYTVLLKPLPVRDPGGLLQFGHYNEQRRGSSKGCNYADVVGLAARLDPIAALRYE